MNRITGGFNPEYAMNFSHMHLPYIAFAGIGIDRVRWSLGINFSFEYNIKASVSELFGFTEKIRLINLPLFFKFRYLLWKTGCLFFYSNAGFGYFFSRLYLEADPAPDESGAYFIYSNGVVAFTGLTAEYPLTKSLLLWFATDFWYAGSAAYRYGNEGVQYDKNEIVMFADGTDLTLNLTGLKFILGIKFKWGIK
ncbi:MAG: hypothetical protein JXA66_04235 [Oligoflexia bacterium]|nr:hypothetical protein [Oligoflexia bacterium]